MQSIKTQQGNVLFIILAGIALFAILTATISATMSGDVDMDDDRAKVRASHVLEQETILRGAYKMLRLANNCDVNEINFSQTADNAYNANAPTNGRCSLYHAAGAGLRPIAPMENTQTNLANTYEEFWVETSGLEVAGVGTTSSANAACPGCDLSVVLYSIHEDVCRELNMQVMNAKTVYQLSGSKVIEPRAFDGTFGNDAVIDAADDAALVSQRSFCVKEGGGDERHAYIVVLESR